MAATLSRPKPRPCPPALSCLSADGAARFVLCALLVLVPLALCPTTVDPFEQAKAALLTAGSVVLVGLGLAGGAFRGESLRRLRLVRDPLLSGFVLLTISAIVSTVFSLSPRTSWRGAVDSNAGLQTVLGYLVVFLATRASCRTPADARRLLAAAVAGAALVASYAVVQAVGLDPLTWHEASTVAGRRRVFSTVGHPIALGAYLVLAGPVVALLLRQAVQGRRWAIGAALALTAAAMGLALITAMSRAAWLGAVATGLVLLAGWWRSGARRACAAMIGLVLVGAFAGLFVARTGTLPKSWQAGLAERVRRFGEVGGRGPIWKGAWALFRAHPVCGCGLDSFRIAFGSVRPAELWRLEWGVTPSRAHNEALHLLATQGVLGGLCELAFLAGLAWAAARSWSQGPPGERPVVAALVAGLAGFLVCLLFGFLTIGSGLLFVVMAAILSREADQWADTSDQHRPSRLPLAALCASAAVAAFLVGPSLRAHALRKAGCELTRAAPEQAVVRFEQAVALDPADDRGWFELSNAALLVARESRAEVDYRKAQQALERAVALVPADPYHHAGLAKLMGERACLGHGGAERALREWEVALKLDPGNVLFLAEAARTALAVGQPARARDYAERGLTLAPDYAPLMARLGFCALAEGRPAEAASILRRALQANWQDESDEKAPTCASLAAACLALRQYEAAETAATDALRLRPDWPLARNLADRAHQLLSQSPFGSR